MIKMIKGLWVGSYAVAFGLVANSTVDHRVDENGPYLPAVTARASDSSNQKVMFSGLWPYPVCTVAGGEGALCLLQDRKSFIARTHHNVYAAISGTRLSGMHDSHSHHHGPESR